MQHASANLAGKDVNIVCSVSRFLMGLLFFSDCLEDELTLGRKPAIRDAALDMTHWCFNDYFLLSQYIFSFLFFNRDSSLISENNQNQCPKCLDTFPFPFFLKKFIFKIFFLCYFFFAMFISALVSSARKQAWIPCRSSHNWFLNICSSFYPSNVILNWKND